MKKDIDFLRAKHVKIVTAVEEKEGGKPEWAVWLLNPSDHKLDNVIVTSHGYGDRDGRRVVTSKLRQHFEKVEPGANIKVELIDQELFSLTNEYWVSYYIDGKIYDRKVVFLPESIISENLVRIKELGLMGVRHS